MAKEEHRIARMNQESESRMSEASGLEPSKVG